MSNCRHMSVKNFCHVRAVYAHTVRAYTYVNLIQVYVCKTSLDTKNKSWKCCSVVKEFGYQ
jgi:hypothetical protein